MAIKKFPCKGCTNRTKNCHSFCEDYIKAKEDYEKEKEDERRHADIERFLIDSIVDRVGNHKSINKKVYIQKNYVQN